MNGVYFVSRCSWGCCLQIALCIYIHICQLTYITVRACVRVCSFVRVCVCACARACVCTRARACSIYLYEVVRAEAQELQELEMAACGQDVLNHHWVQHDLHVGHERQECCETPRCGLFLFLLYCSVPFLHQLDSRIHFLHSVRQHKRKSSSRSISSRAPCTAC